MQEIINWNALWKIMRSSSTEKPCEEEASSLEDKYAKLCTEYMMQNKEHTERQIEKIEWNPEYTVLDIGSGVGRLAIPIAKRVKTVTAIDPSRSMLAGLKENMEKESVKNIVCMNKRWEDIKLGVDIEPHDVVVASGSLVMFDMQEALAKMDATAKRYVYLFTSVGKWMDKWMDKELWKAIYGARPSTDYVYLYNILHDMGIYANLEIEDSAFEQRYNNLDEAVNKWKAYTNVSQEKEEILREWLSKNLVKDDGIFCLERKYKSVMIGWEKKNEKK